MNVNDQAIPWWKSRIILGALFSLGLKAAVATGLTDDLDTGVREQLLDTIVLIVSGLGDLLVMHSRAVQKAAPQVVASAGAAAVMNTAAADDTVDVTEGGMWPFCDEEDDNA